MDVEALAEPSQPQGGSQSSQHQSAKIIAAWKGVHMSEASREAATVELMQAAMEISRRHKLGVVGLVAILTDVTYKLADVYIKVCERAEEEAAGGSGGYINQHGRRVPNPCGEIDMQGRDMDRIGRNIRPGEKWNDATFDAILADPRNK